MEEEVVEEEVVEEEVVEEEVVDAEFENEFSEEYQDGPTSFQSSINNDRNYAVAG